MRIQFELMPLHRHLFVEPNPVPVKWAMARLGLCGPALRLPLVELGESHRPTVEAALRACGLLRD
jgi:4-hydroxy-tetrahydrodipicolinate synthase